MAASCGAVDCSLQTSVDGQKGDIAGYVTQSGGRLKLHVERLYTRGGGGGGGGGTAGQCV